MLKVQSARPEPLLRPFVQWYVQRETIPGAGTTIEPVFPHTGAMLVFQFEDIYQVQECATRQFRRSWAATVVGPMTLRRTQLILHDHVQALDVLFRPLGLYRLFGVPVSLVAGGGAEAHAVFGPPMCALYQSLGNAATFPERVKLLNDFFFRLLGQSRSLNAAAQAMRHLAAGSLSKVEEAANRIGISARQLERRSLEWTGMTPKTLVKVSRFERAVKEYSSGNASWLDIAHRVGYYDQMHLIKSFQGLAGASPTEIVKLIAQEHQISFCCR